MLVINLEISGIPKFVDHGVINRDLDYLVISLHGPSVNKIKHYYEFDIDQNLVFTMGQQVLRILERIHSTGYLHCDVKPQNILFHSKLISQGVKKAKEGKNEFVLIDYGISMKYVDENGEHIAKKKISKFRGSHEFAAIDVLQLYRKLRLCPPTKLCLLRFNN